MTTVQAHSSKLKKIYCFFVKTQANFLSLQQFHNHVYSHVKNTEFIIKKLKLHLNCTLPALQCVTVLEMIRLPMGVRERIEAFLMVPPNRKKNHPCSSF